MASRHGVMTGTGKCCYLFSSLGNETQPEWYRVYRYTTPWIVPLSHTRVLNIGETFSTALKFYFWTQSQTSLRKISWWIYFSIRPEKFKAIRMHTPVELHLSKEGMPGKKKKQETACNYSLEGMSTWPFLLELGRHVGSELEAILE